jgi:phosphoribosylformylglycinamidine (FGAM) synthase-like enzyme
VKVCDLEMRFLHKGRPRFTQRSVFERPAHPVPRWELPKDLGATLRAVLASPNVASKEWIIRQYDHEVLGGSVLKPLQGVEEDGPGDGVVFAPKFDSRRGIVVGCGINPLYGDLDPNRMAVSAVDEAVRNVVAAGGDPARTAILDNFCWGNTERPETLGSLVEAARGCYRAAVALGTPFVSGKDSLNNDYRVGDEVVSIPPTLLISSISITDDIYRLVSMDLKAPGNELWIVGDTRDEMGGSHFFSVLGLQGGVVPDLPPEARALHQAVAHVIERGLALSCHDLSEGGLAVAVAEMAFSGQVGAELRLGDVPFAEGTGTQAAGQDGPVREDVLLFSESNARYLLEVRSEDREALQELLVGVPHAPIGETIAYKILRILSADGRPVLAEALEDLKRSWKDPLTKRCEG